MYISVGNPPVITSELDDVTVTSPEAVSLQCTVDLGNPKASVEWFKNDKPISSGRKYDVSCEDGVAKLVVKESEFCDAGAYRVVASNKLGSAQSQCSVTVYCKFANYIC